MKTNFKKKCLLCSLSILFCIILTEGFLRIFNVLYLPIGIPNLSGKCSFPDNPAGYFKFAYNSDGFRTNEIAKEKSNLNIFIIGDSQAYGSGVDQGKTMTELLEKKLIKTNRNFRCYNLSTPASSLQYYQSTFLYALKQNPYCIVLLPYQGNDLVEFEIESKTLPKQDSNEDTVKKSHLQTYHLYHLIAQAKGKLFAETSIAPTPSLLSGEECVGQSIMQIKHFENRNADLQLVLKKIDDFLSSFRLLTKEQPNAPSVLWAIIPSKFNVISIAEKEDNNLDAVLEKYNIDFKGAKEFDSQALSNYTDLFRKHFPDNEIKIDPFIQSSNAKNMYWGKDWHLNDDGHEFFSELIHKRILKLSNKSQD